MTLDFSALENEPRLLIEVPLRPVQGSRFQPTGFPDLGAATFTGFDENGEPVDCLLVESAQSMANRLEAVCWDSNAEEGGAFIDCLDGTPFVRCKLPNGRFVTSVTESHRLNSPYFQATRFQSELCKHVKFEKGQPWNLSDLAKFLFRYDPNSLIHGVFFSSIQDGRMRLPRTLSAFIEAELPENGRGYAESGFTRREDADPSGEIGAQFLDQVPDSLIKELGYSKPGDYRSKLKENVKNIPGAITEFTAKSIVAYFSVDLAQIRAFGLPREAYEFLVGFALLKIRLLLESPLRLRSRCDLCVAGPIQVTPNDFVLPDAEALKSEMPALVEAAKGLFFPKPYDAQFEVTKKKAKK